MFNNIDTQDGEIFEQDVLTDSGRRNMQTDRTCNTRYLNWIKTSLSLLYLKEGLQDFCNEQAKCLHQLIQQNIQRNHARAAITKCTNCACANIKRTKVKHSSDYKWQMNCNSHVCDIWLEEILQYHEHLPCPKVEWFNCNPQLWPDSPWEVAKVFQPYGCQHHKDARESDCAALMTLMLDCKVFNSLLSGKHLLRDVKDCRNKTMHSGNLEIDDVVMTSYLDNMIAILEDPIYLLHQSACKDAVIKIKQLHDNHLDLSLNKDLEHRALFQRMEALEVDIKFLQEESESLRTDMCVIATEQEIYSEEQEKIQDKVNLIETSSCQITQLTELLNQVQTQVSNLQSDVPHLSALSDNLQTVESKHEKLEIEIGSMADLTKVISGKVDAIADNVETVYSRVDNVELRSEMVEKDLARTESKLGQIDTKVETVTCQVESIDSVCESVRSRIDNVDTKVKEINKSVGDVKREVDDVVVSVVHPLSDKIETVLDRLERTEANLLKLNESRTSGNTRNDVPTDEVRRLQNHLISLYNRYCQQVPIYPFKPNWKTKVKDLYVKPSMKVVDPRGKRKDTDNEESYVDRQSRTDIQHVADIFFEDGKPCRDIYISGEAGVGKSTLCEHLVSLWCQCHSGEAKELSESDRVMENFPLLFYISLRDVDKSLTDYDHIETMAKSQLQLPDVNFAKLVIESEVMFLLDDLDELAPIENITNTRFQGRHLPRRRHSDRITIVTTSRPWKLETLGPELECKIDRQILMTGLKKKSHEALTKKVVELLNTEYKRNKRYQDFYKEIRDKRLTNYLETPVLLTQMIGLWYSGTPLGNSQCEVYINMIDKQIQFAEEIRERSFLSSKLRDPYKDKAITCFKNKQYCIRQQKLLLKLAKVAYEGLFGGNMESALVFDHRQTEFCGMSAKDVQECLNIGLLTQNKVFGEVAEELKSVSFIHKTHQEFFAALFLSNCFQRGIVNIFKPNKDKKSISGNTILSKSSDLDCWLEQEKVMTFISGMNPKIAAEMSQSFMKCVAEDIRIQVYRTSFENTDNQTILVKRIQRLIFDCWVEAMRNGFKGVNLQLDDFYIDHYNFEAVCRTRLDTTFAKSVVVQTIETTGTGEKEECMTILRSRGLQKICVFDWGGILKPDMIHDSVHGSKYTLQVLCLSDVELPSKASDFADIFSAPNLTVLRMREIELPHKLLSILLEKISKAAKLRELYMRRVKCSTHPYGVACDFSIMLSKSTLRSIELIELIPEINIRESTSIPFKYLQKVSLGWLTITTESFRMLMSRLPDFGTAVNLEDMTVKGRGSDCELTLIREDPNNIVSEDYMGLIDIGLCRITHMYFKKKEGPESPAVD